jgi:nicotinate-nucleotide pyrophosphorylase (carboxylating)
MHSDFHQLEWDAAIEDDLRQLIRLAVREDLSRQQDWTTVALVDAERRGSAAVVARQPGVIAGMQVLPVLVDEMQAAINIDFRVRDGARVNRGEVLAQLDGSARDLLVCERPLLNFLGRLSGVATLASQFVDALAGTNARIYDTRKTTPGWRRLEKFAVRCGGGCNHRTGLFDAILIKDNHLALASGENVTPADAVRRAKRFLDDAVAAGLTPTMPIEVEIDSLHQWEEVLAAGPDIVLLDNMSQEELRTAVGQRNTLAPQIQLEASGGVCLESVREIAQTGVDRISAGCLTHSAPALDLALDWQT